MTGKRMIAAIFMLLLSLNFIGCKMQTNATKKLSDLDYTIVSGRELPDELYDILEEKKTESFKLTYEENDGLTAQPPSASPRLNAPPPRASRRPAATASQ